MSPIYLVCDDCGFFYGDVRLYEEQTVDCPECGTTVAKAYGQLSHALDYRETFAPRDDFGPSHPEHPEHVCGPSCSDVVTQKDTAPWYEDPAGKPPYLGPIP